LVECAHIFHVQDRNGAVPHTVLAAFVVRKTRLSQAAGHGRFCFRQSTFALKYLSL
jgi:hypothetical protein